MTLRTVMLLAGALSTAGLTALAVNNWMAAQRAAMRTAAPAPAERPALATTEILVAARDLPVGSFIRPQDLTWQAWPDPIVADDHMTRSEAGEATFDGAVARRGLLAGEPLTDRHVVHAGERGFLAAVLEPGSRAVSVPVDATTGIAGFIFPGDRVDILLTFRTAVKDEESQRTDTRQYSETLLRDIRVLAMDQAVENENGTAQLAKTATLEVTPKQAEAVALGLQLGTLSLSLRSLARDPQHGDTITALASGEPAQVPGQEVLRSFTADSDVLFMLGRRGGPSGNEPIKIHVLRGSEAEAVEF